MTETYDLMLYAAVGGTMAYGAIQTGLAVFDYWKDMNRTQTPQHNYSPEPHFEGPTGPDPIY